MASHNLGVKPQIVGLSKQDVGHDVFSFVSYYPPRRAHRERRRKLKTGGHSFLGVDRRGSHKALLTDRRLALTSRPCLAVGGSTKENDVQTTTRVKRCGKLSSCHHHANTMRRIPDVDADSANRRARPLLPFRRSSADDRCDRKPAGDPGGPICRPGLT